jgi:hypothetical protein
VDIIGLDLQAPHALDRHVRMPDDPPAFVSQRHAFIGTLQQGQAQFALQILDGTAQRRLGDMQHLRGFIDAAALVDRDQGSDLMEFHGVRLAFYLAPTIKQDAGQLPLCR